MSDDAAAVEESDGADAESTDEDAPDSADESAAETADEQSGATAVSEQSVASLVEQITDHEPELAAVAEELHSRIESLESDVAEKEAEIEELTEKLSRERANFKNYKKRTEKQQEKLKARATEDLVERLTSVRDNLVRALDQDADADIRPGVESTLETFDRTLEDENVEFISPAAGDEVDPERHEVMQRVDSDQPEGTIVDVYQDGYAMAEKILQPARVTVSTGTDD